MPNDVLASTEVVFLNATRFADFRHRQGVATPGVDVRVAPLQLARTLAFTALVGCYDSGNLRLALEHESLILGFGRRDVVRVGLGLTETSPPEGTLEAAIAASARDHGAVRPLLRDAVRYSPGAGSVTDAVRLGMAARGYLVRDENEADVPTEDARKLASPDEAATVERMLSDFRCEYPELAVALRREIDRFLWTHGADAIAAVPRGPIGRRVRKRASEVDLSDWERLNRDPPSATKPKE